MIKYFQPAKKGGKVTEMYFRQKFDTFQKHPLINKYLSKKLNTLILGKSLTGKTYSLNKFVTHHKTLYPKVNSYVCLSGHNTLDVWVNCPDIVNWCLLDGEVEYPYLFGTDFYRLFLKYCFSQRPVIYLDDAHKLKRSELKAIRIAIVFCKFIATARSISACAPSLRLLFDKSTTQIFSLNDNDFADKATSVALALLVCI